MDLGIKPDTALYFEIRQLYQDKDEDILKAQRQMQNLYYTGEYEVELAYQNYNCLLLEHVATKNLWQ